MRRSRSDDIDYCIFRHHYIPDTHYPMMMTATMSVALDDERFYPRESFLLEILGSCNGLILISIDKGNLFLWNPTTRQAKNIAPPESHGSTDAWHSRYGYFIYGFGHDDSTDDYKIVCIFVSYLMGPGTVTTTEIYSSRTNSWKRIESFGNGVLHNRGRFTTVEFVKGKLHWLTYIDNVDGEIGCNWDIVALDLAEEKYEIMGRPHYLILSLTHYKLRLHVLGGYLSLTTHNEKFGTDVWIMTKYGEKESWVKVWTCCHSSPRPCPLWTTTMENGDIVVSFPTPTGLRVVVYNGRNALHASRVDIVDPTFFDVDFEPNMFVESLVSPFGMMK